ncbi:putative disease resistance protein At4g19050 [Magnolia sinica]|uniref:putative disease resistance protein At4g19050 n=1 Tax=Magnolia sinica TaxID=86752 RepID=UPI002658B0D1|nr:putative disease resistance protein At4g19050 [Magnolia sinica]
MVIPDRFFQNMRAAQITSLSHAGISSLPSSLFHLSDLRVLILRGCRELSELPSSTGKFKKLEVLDVLYSRIRNLPKEVGELGSLRKLGLRETRLKTIQFEISKLHDLGDLDMFKCTITWVDRDNIDKGSRSLDVTCGVSLKDIINLASLTSLQIMVEKFESIDAEIIGWLRRLRRFHLVIGPSSGVRDCDDFLEENYDKVLVISFCKCESVDDFGALSDLECLIILTCSRLTTISSLVGPQSRLRDLRIENCNNVTEMIGCRDDGQLKKLENLSLVSLPLLEEELELGENLRSIRITGCSKLKNLWNSLNRNRRVKDLYVGDCEGTEALGENQFAELEKLSICWLPLLNSIGIFQSLKSLRVWRCTELKSFPFGFQRLENLQVLHVSDMCNVEQLIDCEFEEGITVLPRLGDLQLMRLQSFTSIWEGKLRGGSLGNLGEMTVSSCPKLKALFSSGFVILGKLKKVCVDHCDELEKIAEEAAMEDEGITLQRLELANVPRLSSIFAVKSGVGALENLVVLYLSHCSELKVVIPPSSHGLLPKLNHIYVGDCELQDGSLKSLKSIDVAKCPELKNLLSSGLDKLEKLRLIRVNDCDGLETIVEKNPIEAFALPALQSLCLSNLGALKMLWRNGMEMGSLRSLQTLKLGNCTRLETLWDGELEDGVLSSLKTLSIWKCPELKILIPSKLRKLEKLEEIQVNDSGIEMITRETLEENALQSLKKIELRSLSRLEVLWVEGELGPDSLKDLKRVLLRDSELLKSLPFGLIKCRNLDALVVENCVSIGTVVSQTHVNVFLTLASMCLRTLPKVKAISEKKMGVGCLENLEYLILTRIQGLKSLPPDLHMLQKLKQLNVRECNEMEALITGGPWEEDLLPSLMHLNIKDLPKLKIIWEAMPGTVSMKNLKGFYVKGCKVLDSLPYRLMKLDKLEQLRVKNCDEMETVFRMEGEETAMLPSMIEVKLEKMPRLRRIWEGRADLPKLSYVSVIDCPKLKNIYFAKNLSILESIRGSKDWWDTLELEADVRSDLQKCFKPWPMAQPKVLDRRFIRRRPCRGLSS